MLSVVLPDGFYFLESGWWVVHILAISLVLLTGFLLGSRSRFRREVEASGETSDISDLPLHFRFLRRGWWAVHVTAIALFFILGHMLWPSN